MIVNKEVFFQAVQKMGYVPFEQSSAWQEFKSVDEKSLVGFIDNNQEPFIACWGRIFKKPGIGKILDIVGEVKRENISPKQVQYFFENLIKEAACNMIIYSSVSDYKCTFDISMRRSGFTRPLGNRVCPLTIFIKLKEERNPDRNWKRNIKKSISEKLEFKVIDSPSLEDAKIVSGMFNELKKMKNLSYSLDANCLFKLLMDEKYKLFYVVKDGVPLCARVIYIHRQRAADVFAANTFESRKYAATHLIVEKILEYLKKNDVEVFDFSRIPPSNNETDSVYVFKNSAGGYPVQYNGEWIWSKKKVYSLLFCIYNFFIRKAHQY